MTTNQAVQSRSIGLSGREVRSVQRAVHLIAAGALGAYVYSPLAAEPGFVALVKLAVFPVLTVSGLLLWQYPRLRRWFARNR